MDRMKVVVVVLDEDLHPACEPELVGALGLFRGVKGVAKAEDGGIYEVLVPREQHEPLFEAFRRLDLDFKERS